MMGKVIMSGIVPQLVAPVTGIMLSDLAEGSIVKLKENGVFVDFYVAKHGYEAALNGSPRTLLVRKEVCEKRVWNSVGLNTYSGSDVDVWLNGEYKERLTKKVKRAIGETSFYYTQGNGNTAVSVLSRSVFLLSFTEISGSSSDANAEGQRLPISLSPAYLNGVSTSQWTRTPVVFSGDTTGSVKFLDGSFQSAQSCTVSHGVRPCFTVPSTFIVQVSGIDDDTLLLLHGDSISDSSNNSLSLTNNGVVVSQEQSKFGGSSLHFNGNARLLFPSVDLAGNDFTIDWWEYVTSGESKARFCSLYTTGNNSGGLLLGYNGTVIYAGAGDSDWTLVNGVKMLSNTLNEWVHWAVVRSGTSLKTYRNGKLFASTTINGAFTHYTTYQSVIGDYRAGDHAPFIGFIDEFRISKTARWATDFAPPERAYRAENEDGIML